MKIQKAIKIQKRNSIIFYLTMVLLGFSILALLHITKLNTTFIIVYGIILESLILVAILVRISSNRIKFTYASSRLKVKMGLFLKESIFQCDKVAVVHTNKYDYDLEIIMVTTSKLRNKKLKPVTKSFLNKFPEINAECERIRRVEPNTLFYFQIIRTKNLLKYYLLEKIYVTCVKSVYTKDAIESIKIARGQNED